ncbi:hypothetical protein L1765_11110 [Microaerobacter geothermalis]|uniref:hypothetical protein n=1 Tax=Microaerobacter geothermalis TaxID=674972 RepID=UPI001F1DE0BB|nr:hypothetical protein [Microaerobacter geothermalis]MCF6094512.1 hypothetical protein [Microaerobacter geothermalis]
MRKYYFFASFDCGSSLEGEVFFSSELTYRQVVNKIEYWMLLIGMRPVKMFVEFVGEKRVKVYEMV